MELTVPEQRGSALLRIFRNFRFEQSGELSSEQLTTHIREENPSDRILCEII